MEDEEKNKLFKQIEDLQIENAELRSEIENRLETLIDVIPDVWDDGYTVGKNHKGDDNDRFPKERRHNTCMTAINKIEEKE